MQDSDIIYPTIFFQIKIQNSQKQNLNKLADIYQFFVRSFKTKLLVYNKND